MRGASGMSTVRRTASLLAVSCLVLCPAFGSEFQELNTDRDAFTPATTTAKLGTTIIEASYVWIDNRGTPATNSFPELLVRLGTQERFEWRLGVNYEQGSGGSVVSAVEVGEAPLGEAGGEEATILYGAKVRVTDQDGWIPRSAAIIEGFTPVGGAAHARDAAVGGVCRVVRVVDARPPRRVRAAVRRPRNALHDHPAVRTRGPHGLGPHQRRRRLLPRYGRRDAVLMGS